MKCEVFSQWYQTEEWRNNFCQSQSMSFHYWFVCMNTHANFYLYQHFLLLIKLHPHWHRSAFRLKLTSCSQRVWLHSFFVFLSAHRVQKTINDTWHSTTPLCGLQVLSWLQQSCRQECRNTSVSTAVMGTDEHLDWMQQWIDSVSLWTIGSL